MLKRMKQVAMAALAGFAFLMASCSSGSSSSIPFIPSSGSSSSSDSGPTVLEEGEVWTKTETDAKYKAAAALAAELDPNNEKYILFYYEDGKTSYSDRAT